MASNNNTHVQILESSEQLVTPTTAVQSASSGTALVMNMVKHSYGLRQHAVAL